MKRSIALPISEPSQAGEARRVAIALAGNLGFNETERGKVGIVVTELANNLVRYAQNGLLLLQEIQKASAIGIEILSLDQGPGIEDIQRCMSDGYSTGGTAGNGLGAIHRLSSYLDIYSMLGKGTAIVAHLWSTLPQKSPQKEFDLGAICLPKTGEDVSGDAWAYETYEQQSLLLVADGLGHGLLAAEASLEAVRVFKEHKHRDPQAIIEAAHRALRSTRGAALAIAAIDLETQSVRFAGVGNIAGSTLSGTQHHNLVSYNGTVGHAVRKVQQFTSPWQPGGLLIMHSDGLSSQWRLDRYPGLIHKHPSLIAGVLYRDFNRGRDDVTVLVAREGQ